MPPYQVTHALHMLILGFSNRPDIMSLSDCLATLDTRAGQHACYPQVLLLGD